jgi:hypothetical protein
VDQQKQAIQLQSQATSLLKNHMLSNSFMNNGKKPFKSGIGLGHHQTEKDMWAGNTNLSHQKRMGLIGPIMIGETVASNMHNLPSLQTQNRLQVSSTVGRNIVGQLNDQGIGPGLNLNNMSALLHQGSAMGGASLTTPYDLNQFNTNQQMYESFVRNTLAKKRQSQYSERKAAKERERFMLKHEQAVHDFEEHAKQVYNHNLREVSPTQRA